MINQRCIFCKKKFKLPAIKSRILKAKFKNIPYEICEYHYTMMFNNWDDQQEPMMSMLKADLAPAMLTTEDKFRLEWDKVCKLFKKPKKERETSWLWKS